MNYSSFRDELVKIAGSKWTQFLRKAGPEEVKKYVPKLYRSAGSRPPFHMERFTPEKIEGMKEKWIKSIRGYQKAKPVEAAPRGTPEWRSAMKDIKHGRMVPVESGLSSAQARDIKRYGPSSPLLGSPDEPMRMPQSWWRGMREASPKASDKGRVGIWTHPAGTPRTEEYARRAAESGGTPSKMTFSIPQTFVEKEVPQGSELAIPREMFQRWGRNVKVSPV